MRCYRITLAEESRSNCSVCGSRTITSVHRRGASYIERAENLGSLADMMKDGNSAYMIEPIELDEEQLNNLAEFTGF